MADKNILHMVTPLKHMSPFDVNMAIDAGYDAVFPYTDVKLEEIRQAIAELPERQRAAVIMHKYEELEYTQIAGALGCSPQTVKSLLFRAYTALRVRLAHLA